MNTNPKYIELTLSSPFYELMRTGKRSFDVRPFTETLNDLKTGDIIVFTHSTKTAEPVIKKVSHILPNKEFNDVMILFED